MPNRLPRLPDWCRRALPLVILALVVARPLAGASSQDLVGDWVVDVDATWQHMLSLPQVSSLTPDQLPVAKQMLATQLQGRTLTFTTTSLISTLGGDAQKESFVVTKVDGDTLYTDDTSADGKVTHSQITVGANRLSIADPDNGMVAVLVRK